MKKLVLILCLFSSFAFAIEAETEAGIENAASAFPNVFVYPNQVQVQVHNYGMRDVWCSGSVTVYRQSGRTQNEYYSQHILRGMTNVRYFNNYDFNDRFTRAHHSIFCR